jgi:hypothetical protein
MQEQLQHPQQVCCPHRPCQLLLVLPRVPCRLLLRCLSLLPGLWLLLELWQLHAWQMLPLLRPACQACLLPACPARQHCP